MITCTKCTHYPPKKDGWPCVDCLDNDRYEKSQTNADRIRAMTDEELAEWLDNIDTAYEPETVVSRRGWLDWLRQIDES